ncbi:pilus assembly protein PilM [[Clostridium] innocuum]|nr:pilus assembly protein PilM [[Clostridium] innocuum]
MAKEYVIYISSHAVQMIYGSCDKKDMIKIEAFHEYPLEEGAMINGVITDDSSILEILKELHENGVKEARLVIDSGQILVKNIQVPQLSKKELLKVARDELSDIDGSYEDLVYDYSVLQSAFADENKKGGEILCCAAERKLLTSYIELFESAEIKLKSMDISINALHKLTQELADLDNKTYIVSVLDGNNVSSYLFEKNHYTFSNRTRLFSERGTQAFISEMNSNISQLIQFSKSKQSPYPIEIAYFCGLDDAEERMVFESIRTNLSMQAEQFPDSKIVYVTAQSYNDFHLHDYLFPVGCLIRK